MYISKSVKVTLWAGRLIALALVALMFLMPGLLRWYAGHRPLDLPAERAIAIAFYCCCLPVGAALWDMDRLMRNILDAQVFINRNVTIIRRIRWYCVTTGLICLPAAWFYPPLIFVVVIMGFLSLVVTVLSNVMRAAVEIREENDLTI